ncbi:MAG: pimelyl-acyl-carrier protein methyl ester esterase [Gammaproteobacteria bacterium]|nr:MAG: pimelyl-acyl-carrier protein methyl ester esterase [Gammaproteobacteria bacterium]TND03676.1 MAG: pimelyl-acyl-carrier protein methyl ester esterase [Gammaproteobacteria bacterium]
MKLYVESHGNGPELVLIHGWGLHGGIWKSITADLAKRYRVTIIDLPGHGRSRVHADDDMLAAYAEAVAQVAPEQATWLGWSLGATVAMRAALDMPRRIERLILVAATPQFVAGRDWPAGMKAAEFDAFADNLAHDVRATLTRFLALQVRDANDAANTLRQLRALIANRPLPGLKALQQGLDILRHTNLRDELADIHCPALLIHGTKDSLIPPHAAQAMQSALPQATLDLIHEAGHAPFLSHKQRFLHAIDGFIDD